MCFTAESIPEDLFAKKEYNLVYLNLRPKWTSESKWRGQLADFALKLALGLFCREEKKK